MEDSIFLYAVYNLVTGPFFALYYYLNEKEIKSGKEFTLLFFLPAVGFGNWKYNQIIRRNETSELPRKWYIWKYMSKVNMGIFIPVFAVCGLVALASLFGGDLGGFYVTLIMIPIALVFFGIAFLILVYLPMRQAKSIETELYRMHYLKEKYKQEQQENTLKK